MAVLVYPAMQLRRFAKGCKQALCYQWIYTLAILSWANTLCAQQQLTLWHTQDSLQSQFLGELVKLFTKETGIKIEMSTGMDLVESLAVMIDKTMPSDYVERGEAPDMVLAPSDLVHYLEIMKFSRVDRGKVHARIEEDIWNSLALAGHVYGVPILQGNHLMLYINKSLLKHTKDVLPAMDFELTNLDWLQATTAKLPLAFHYENAYTFAAFLLGSGLRWDRLRALTLNSQACQKVFAQFTLLAEEGLINTACDFTCITQGFYRGESAFLIQGDWILKEAMVRLGDKLALAPLPKIAGTPMKSFKGSLALFFPDDSLEKSKEKSLMAFANFLTSTLIQRQWLETMLRFPANRLALAELKQVPFGKVMFEQLKAAQFIPSEKSFRQVWRILERGITLKKLAIMPPRNVCELISQRLRSL